MPTRTDALAALEEIVHRETRAWDTQDVELLLSVLHPDMVWPWPPHVQAHDPANWVLPWGRYDRTRWARGWQELFDTHALVGNTRLIQRIEVSAEGDGGFAVVDIDTRWRHRDTGVEQRWVGRTCKIYTTVAGEWKMTAQTGVLDYTAASALGRAMAMVADLRERCPWDRVQTRETLRPYLLEEVHELAAAIGDNDPTAIRAEVGDLLLHLAWQLVLAHELGEFTPDEAAGDLELKMRRRHPHLFDLGPREGWETLKRKERNGSGGTLDGLPATLPDLLMAYRLQERAASIGFDWPDSEGPLAKVREELAEIEAECTHGAAPDRLEDEIGDLLFSVVNLSRKLGVQPGGALDRANRKFRGRFEAVERLASARGLDLHGAGLEALDRLWDEVKRNEP